jgi:SAM-dependent methyltransferase
MTPRLLTVPEAFADSVLNSHMEDSAPEIERIRAAYRERDAASETKTSPWLDPAYRLQLHELERALLEELGTAGVDPAGGRVLEVGCGAGYFLNRFLEYGAAHAAGIDLMEERISRAAERYPRLELVAGDASRLPWADESFDLVTQFTCLSSVLDADVRQAMASEMWRVLAPGGAVVSFDIRPAPSAVRALGRLASLRAGRGRAAGTATAPVEADELTRWFPAQGIRFRSVGLYPELGRILARKPLLAQLAARLPALHVHMLAVGKKEDHARL